MKKLVPILLLLLAGCGTRDNKEEQQTTQIQQNLLAGLENAHVSEDPAQVQALVDRAVPAALPKGAKVDYRNVRAGVGGAACGELAMLGPKDKPGPYRHFVVTPEAVAVIGSDSQIKFNDPSDFLADAWIRWCASPEELKLVEGQIGQGPPPSDDLLPTANVPNIPDEPMPPTARQTGPTRTATAAPRRAPPPAQIDSFAKSVSRPD